MEKVARREASGINQLHSDVGFAPWLWLTLSKLLNFSKLEWGVLEIEKVKHSQAPCEVLIWGSQKVLEDPLYPSTSGK